MRKPIQMIAIIAMAGLLSACAAGSHIRHDVFMRGQVVQMDDSQAVICIGSADGAEVGQELDAYRVNITPVTDEGSDYKLDLVGNVRISSIFDEHFAKAEVLNGDVRRYDVVELKR